MTWITLAHEDGMRPFSTMVLPYIMFNRTENLFEVLSRREDGYALRSHANDLAESTGPVSETKEVASKVSERSAAVEKALQSVTYLYL